MDYRAALEYFRDRSDYDRGFISNPFAGDEVASAGLARTRELLNALGSPDRAYPIIHVAGTKGKGSTCAFIESVARQAGLRTGMFTTPHLHSVRERIQIDGRPIAGETWAAAMERCARAVSLVEAEHEYLGKVTAFELNTALALLVFGNALIDLGIVEVGLGGRLDATNVVSPQVSVITPVSFDHQAILGDTLDLIAAEKAGIIKPDTPVVVAVQEPEAGLEIASWAEALNAPLYRAGTNWKTSFAGGRVTLSGPWGEIPNVRLGLRGRHQAGNAGTALMALHLLNPALIADTATAAGGLRDVHWPGRYELVQPSPAVIVDGAHNGASAGVLADALLDDYPDHDFVIIFGTYTDKDLASMLTELEPLSPTLVATRSRSPRARNPSEILDVARSMGFDIEDEPSVDRAIETALGLAGHRTVVVATGSLSIVAEAREHFELAEITPVESEVLGG